MEKYILIVVALISLGIAAILGPVLIPVLHRLKFGQQIREIGPSWHKKKNGTPTMGGFIFIIPTIITTLIFIRDTKILIILLFSLIFGVIGFLDDFIKVILKRNLGLTEKQKSLLQIFTAIVFVFVYLSITSNDTSIVIPFIDKAVTLPIYVYIPFVLFVIVGATNSVNLTDGVDGLASCVTVVVCAFFALVSYKMGEFKLAGFCIINMASIMGFLIFNLHPAKVFMGDTGSLYLGGVICFVSIVLKMPLILIIAGGIYVLETLSVIIQVASFKLTGKRVFKMSPIHHHFEMCGWSEKKIVTAATVSTIVLCAISYIICV